MGRRQPPRSAISRAEHDNITSLTKQQVICCFAPGRACQAGCRGSLHGRHGQRELAGRAPRALQTKTASRERTSVLEHALSPL